MVTESEVFDIVKGLVNKGVDDDSIMVSLVKAGYDSSEVSSAIDKFRNKTKYTESKSATNEDQVTNIVVIIFCVVLGVLAVISVLVALFFFLRWKASSI